MSGFQCSESDLWHASQIPLSEDWRRDSELFLGALFKPEEFANINTDFTTERKKDNTLKANPKGAGVTKPVCQWLELLGSGKIPQSKAGAWLRINPVREIGSGKAGAHEDRDVMAFRFLLFEIDILPLPVQLALMTKVPSPIAALVTSAGRSLQAIVKVDAPSPKDYAQISRAILAGYTSLGIDEGNKNPSRYCRLPGAFRWIGAAEFLGADDIGRQRLLYLNPNPETKPIFP